MDEALERQLRDMADRDAIRQVMLRYARGLDRLDSALARSCYWDDATEDHGHFVGPPDDFIAWADGTTLRFEVTQHAILNHVCELAGDDAYCETYYHFTGLNAEGPHFMSTGRYVDHFQRRGGEWRIANRVCIVEGQFDVSQAASTALMPPAYTEADPCQATRGPDDVSYHRPPVPRREGAHSGLV